MPTVEYHVIKAELDRAIEYFEDVELRLVINQVMQEYDRRLKGRKSLLEKGISARQNS